MLKVREVQARSILNKSKVYDYCLNPYTGCQVACRYCYARLFIPRYSGHPEPWGGFVDIKVNAPEILRRQLLRARRGTVWIASVCDPYQPLEARTELTRRCLEELLVRQFPVVVQTKSARMVRDLDLFERFEDIEVGFTIATEDEKTARLFEPGASPVRERVAALETLHARGIRTFAFLGPLLPGSAERLAGCVAGRADHVYLDRMNYTPTMRAFYARHGLSEFLEDGFFRAQKSRLLAALRRRGVPCRAVD
jgi:DNA repair photolyase